MEERNLNLFKLKVVRVSTSKTTSETVKVSDFTIQNEVLKTILREKYASFNTGLPDMNGNIENFKLVKKDVDPYTVVSFNGGIKTEIKSKPVYLTYMVYDMDDNLKGSVLFNDRNSVGNYVAGGEYQALYSKSTGNYPEVYSVKRNNTTLPDNFLCPQLITEENNIVNFRENTLQNGQNVTYCPKIFWEAGYTLYQDIVNSQNYTVQEFFEFQTGNVNFIFNNGNTFNTINFEISLVIIYETESDDPVPSEDYISSSHVQAVNVYNKNNYSSIYDYNLAVRCDHGCTGGPECCRTPGPQLYGIAYVNSAYAYKYEDQSCNYCIDAPNNFNINNDDEFWFDMITIAHEIGHQFGLAHTWEQYSYPAQPILCPLQYGEPNSASCSCSSTIMSYCFPPQVSEPRISDSRLVTLNTQLGNEGQNMICNILPNEPYLKLEIINTNIIGPNFIYTIELRDCDNNDWYEIETGLNYNDFPRYLIISELPFNANCYAYKVTVDGINAFCEGIENIN